MEQLFTGFIPKIMWIFGYDLGCTFIKLNV